MRIPISSATTKYIKMFYKEMERSKDGKKPSNKIVTKKVDELFKKEFDFISYEEKNGKLVKLVCATKGTNDVGESTIFCCPIQIDASSFDKRKLSLLLNETIKTIGGTKKLTVYTMNFQKDFAQLLEKCWYRLDGQMLRSQISPSLKKIEKRCNRKLPIKIRNYVHKKDWKNLAKIKLLSAKSPNDSCRVSFLKKNARKMLETIWKRSTLDGNSATPLVAYYGKEMVGAILMMYSPRMKYRALVGDIIVSPKFQGMGLSYNLYFEGLKRAILKKKTYFDGGTTTTAVLEMAKKIGRKEYLRSYVNY